MYDTLRCEAPLPNPKMQDHLFQTKSLDCELAEYLITKDGELWRVVGAWGGIGDPEPRQRVDLHGDVTFYDYEERSETPPYGDLVYFTARFTEGKLSRIWDEASFSPAEPSLSPLSSS